jgi:hypothetical protein
MGGCGLLPESMEINGVEASFAPSSYDRSSVIKMAI